MPSVRLALLAALLLAAPAVQAHPLSESEARAVKCFVALIDAQDTAKKRGDLQSADAFEAAWLVIPEMSRVEMDAITGAQAAMAAAHLTDRDLELIAEECQRHYR